MHRRSDPVLVQYRRVALIELATARDAVDRDCLSIEGDVVFDALSRVADMASMLRHRRTCALIEAIVSCDASAFDASDWHRMLDAVQRLTGGGRPHPSLLSEVRAKRRPVMSVR